MGAPRSGRTLCPRCGAVTGETSPSPDGSSVGACSDCGLGYTSSPLTMTPAVTRLGRWRQQRRDRRRIGEQRREMAQAVTDAGFPVYGLDGTWIGRRWASGWSASSTTVTSVHLSHGDPSGDAAPLVRVGTSSVRTRHDGRDASAITGALLAQDLVSQLWHGGADHTDAIRRTFTEPDPTSAWVETTLPVDSEPVPFRSLTSDETWVALGRVGACFVSLHARQVDIAEVRLAVIDDRTPYLAVD